MKAPINVIFLIVLTFVFVTTLSSGKVFPLHGGDAIANETSFSPSDELTQAELLPSEIRLITHLSKEFSVDSRLIFALIKQESQFDRYARSERGAVGLMQI